MTAVLATFLAMAVPGSCAEQARQPGVRVFASTPQAMLFGRRDRRVIRGCTSRARHSILLRVLCCGTRFKLNDRFVGYAYEGTAIGDETSKVGGIDLKTGRSIHYPKISPNSEGGGDEIETGSLVTAYFISPTGSLVWLKKLDGEGFGLYASDRAERLVDQGAIRSVAIGSKTIEYVKDGARMSAPFRR